MRLMVLALCLSLATGGPTLMAEEDTIEALSPEAEAAALLQAERTGRQIYLHDRAAEKVTDALMRVRGFKRNRKLLGWITQAQGDEIAVSFVGRGKDKQPAAFYRATVGHDGELIGKAESLREPEPLTDFESAALRARAAALESPYESCAKAYNTVVLPADEALEQWYVYLLPATTQAQVVPIGGSYRVDVDLSSDSASVRPFTRSCIQLDRAPDTAAMLVSHLLDPVPTEIHVHWSLWAETPLVVAIAPLNSVWIIEGGQIRSINRPAEE